MLKLARKGLDYLIADVTSRLAYRLILNRPIDPGARRHWIELLKTERSRLVPLVNSLFLSEEYHNSVVSSPQGAILLLNYLHRERCNLVKSLPQGNVIVDLGGASPNIPEGSLISMGYKHPFQELIIVDLPPGASHEQRRTADMYDTVVTPLGKIRYHYGSMLSMDEIGLAQNSVDLFWMGQSIEHIGEDDLDQLLELIHKYLKHDGFFCFDTPNRRITAIQFPDNYLHPDHKIEYCFSDLERKLSEAGFEIVETMGIGLAREVIAQNRFLPGFIIENIRINEKPEDSYLFYFRTRKHPPVQS